MEQIQCNVCDNLVDDPYHFSSKQDKHIHVCQDCVEKHGLSQKFINLTELRRGLFLEPGKEYVLKNGDRTGELVFTGKAPFPFHAPKIKCDYTPTGKFWLGMDSKFDIVEEYIP